jgi:hypothetical protein
MVSAEHPRAPEDVVLRIVNRRIVDRNANRLHAPPTPRRTTVTARVLRASVLRAVVIVVA